LENTIPAYIRFNHTLIANISVLEQVHPEYLSYGSRPLCCSTLDTAEILQKSLLVPTSIFFPPFKHGRTPQLSFHVETQLGVQ